jgi:rod shape-determining protein MreC
MLFCFLALYTWNARTGYLDSLAENSGLEVTGYLLRPGTWTKETVRDYWQRYFALVDVAGENARLRDEMRRAEEYLAQVREEHAELVRLRALLGLQPPEGWTRLGARVLSGRFGPGAALESVMIDRGYATGAPPGAPVITHLGLAGRVFRSSPRAGTVILLTDRSFRAAVVTQEGRVPGVIAGNGARLPLELRYVDQNTHVGVGETLVTSGLDGEFPKGIPVARIIRISAGSESLFQVIEAEPVVPLNELEEVAVLATPAQRFATQPMIPPGAAEAAGDAPAETAAPPPAGDAAPPARRQIAPSPGAPRGALR